MAVIHNTTMNPGKLELLAAWLPDQPWYQGAGRPELARVGGFRLDDPQEETGIEFMVVTDGAGDRAVTYQVPMTYRAAPLAGSDSALIGTSQHGVLGLRYLYDGTRDLVFVAQLMAAIQGAAEPQAQTVSHTPDPRVTSQPVWSGDVMTVTGFSVAADGPPGTDLRVETAGASGPLLVRVHRVLEPGTAAQPGLSATWRQPDGTTGHGVFASVQGLAGP
jgi:Maltokinase N-terminal cap domain